MLFTSAITIYQPAKNFEHGEVDSSWVAVGTLYCHIKFTCNEQQSAERKQAIRRAKLTFETFPTALSSRDCVVIGGVVYYLLYTPTPRVGLSGRTIYEVDIVEDFKGEVTI